MAQLGYHVSKGINLWNYDVNKGVVLYLALEDDEKRIQDRIYKMFGGDDNENFYFSNHSSKLNGSLEGQLQYFIERHHDTRLIIIDTLQKVREANGEKYSYGNDYDIVTKLKKFSDRYNVCLLLVHHTRKQQAEDCFETISGTNGLLGAADGAFVLQKDKRTALKATLDIVGRDQQDQRMILEFNKEHCIWDLVEVENELWEIPKDDILEAVSKIVSPYNGEWKGTATDLISVLSLDIQPNMLTRHLNVNTDRLFNEYHIMYKNFRTRESRQVVFNYVFESG